jgi:putative phosphoesterase
VKVAFLSDIHGNAVALEAVLQDIREQSTDQIVVLGDISYRGPEPKKCIELVQQLHTHVIKGNADEWIVRGIRQGEVPERVFEMMQREQEWSLSQLESAEIQYLQHLPTEVQLSINDRTIHAFHATPHSLFEMVLPHAEDELIKSKLMSHSQSELTIYGHIHKSFIRFVESKMVINTGSVGLPFDGCAMASYSMIDIDKAGITASIRRVRYDLERVARQYQDAEYPNLMMINVLRNARIG